MKIEKYFLEGYEKSYYYPSGYELEEALFEMSEYLLKLEKNKSHYAEDILYELEDIRYEEYLISENLIPSKNSTDGDYGFTDEESEDIRVGFIETCAFSYSFQINALLDCLRAVNRCIVFDGDWSIEGVAERFPSINVKKVIVNPIRTKPAFDELIGENRSIVMNDTVYMFLYGGGYSE